MPTHSSKVKVLACRGCFLTRLAPHSRHRDKRLGIRLGKHIGSWKWVRSGCPCATILGTWFVETDTHDYHTLASTLTAHVINTVLIVEVYAGTATFIGGPQHKQEHTIHASPFCSLRGTFKLFVGERAKTRSYIRVSCSPPPPPSLYSKKKNCATPCLQKHPTYTNKMQI